MRFKPSIPELLIFIGGFVFGALLTEWLTVSGVKMAESVSALFTALGVLFAIYAAKNWMHTKEQDDKYLAAKRVFTALATAERELNEYCIRIGPVIPSPGVIYLSNQEVEDAMLGCRELVNRWKTSIRELNTAIAELRIHEIQFRAENEQFQGDINVAALDVDRVLFSLGHDIRNHLGFRLQSPGFDHLEFQGEDLRRHFEQFSSVADSFFSLTKRRLQPIRNFFQF
ncbi:hypothetical protein [Chromobacterium piscinae]|uniref:hypothetical protein n=1 Tax=Chromobacterium piscinae TaxID=686831 RepID=UPI003F7F83FD